MSLNRIIDDPESPAAKSARYIASFDHRMGRYRAMNEAEMRVGIQSAYRQALKSLREGGIPVGSALTLEGAVASLGHNRRVQRGSNVLHGEMDCIENAGH